MSDNKQKTSKKNLNIKEDEDDDSIIEKSNDRKRQRVSTEPTSNNKVDQDSVSSSSSSDEDMDYEMDDEEVDDEEDDDEEDVDEIVDVNFIGKDADKDDFEGIRTLLKRVWLKEHLNLSELTDVLIEDIYTIVAKNEELDDKSDDKASINGDGECVKDVDTVYAVTGAIPFTKQFIEKPCIKQLRELLLSRIPKDNPIHIRLLDHNTITLLLINERFANLPPTVSMQSIKEIVEHLDHPDAEKFEWVIMICKCLKFRDNNDGKGKSKKKEETTESTTTYINEEEEIFAEAAEAEFEYSVANQCDGDIVDWIDDEQMFDPYRKVLLLSKRQWLDTVQKLTQMIATTTNVK